VEDEHEDEVTRLVSMEVALLARLGVMVGRGIV
jgi:hypothetical protein